VRRARRRYLKQGEKQDYIDLFSPSRQFLQNKTVASNLEPIHTCLLRATVQTVYVYAANKLWAAYGIAALFTIGSVIIGIFVVLANGASYSNVFSTVLRIARAAELSIKVQESDLEGKNPLPSYLAKATVVMSGEKDRWWTPNAQEDLVGPKDANAGTALLA
jgi:hypothetical protein